MSMLKEIKENDLPLILRGKEKETFENIYELTTSLDSELKLSLKSYGYINRKAILQSGESIDDAWVKYKS